MDQYEHIRTAHRVYKKSIRQIARETGRMTSTLRSSYRVSPRQTPRCLRIAASRCTLMSAYLASALKDPQVRL
jgi:hypothetical protein